MPPPPAPEAMSHFGLMELPALVGALGAEFAAVLADAARLAAPAGRLPDRASAPVRRLRSAERA